MALYAFSLIEVFCVLRFLLRKPNDLLAVLVTPRYLALAIASRVLPCIVYFVGRGELDLVMCITWHLLELNCISHAISHSGRMSRSACNCSESANLIMAR